MFNFKNQFFFFSSIHQNNILSHSLQKCTSPSSFSIFQPLEFHDSILVNLENVTGAFSIQQSDSQTTSPTSTVLNSSSRNDLRMNFARDMVHPFDAQPHQTMVKTHPMSI
ncbi:Uncharacterized protein TCM_008037 [Theobroma cacao]|uniref:Uncharacterized protein n=1 Tax=Theobroma cacao TaxID=3641 RepID=A0A061E4U3_THECC|nr:Uncharacterized protein TCM_008037 [Theobroma cacao]